MGRRRGESILGMTPFWSSGPADQTRFIAQKAIAADVVCTPLSHQDNLSKIFKAVKMF
jgi:hypothetical protein